MKLGPDGYPWGDGPCIYGSEHNFKRMECLDTGRMITICAKCQKLDVRQVGSRLSQNGREIE